MPGRENLCYVLSLSSHIQLQNRRFRDFVTCSIVTCLIFMLFSSGAELRVVVLRFRCVFLLLFLMPCRF